MAQGNGRLVLQPTIAEMTTEQLEAHLEYVRARRIVAAMEYIEGRHLKYDALADKVRRKLSGQYEMLEKELERLDRALDITERRVEAIEVLRQEYGLLTEYGS